MISKKFANHLLNFYIFLKEEGRNMLKTLPNKISQISNGSLVGLNNKSDDPNF